MKRKYKVITLTVCSILLLSSFFLLFSTLYIMWFAKKNTNSENDERLFGLARGGTLTEYYIDDDSNYTSLNDYNPILNARISLNGSNKLWIPLSDVNENLINGFISVEDRKFYSHSGVNLKRTLYALANTVFHFKGTFGASTITQQVIKNMSGDNELTFKRKLSEIIRAYNLEKNHTKEEILEIYINIVPMGENIYGVGAAAEKYFGKTSSELSLSESAAIVGITNAPGRYNPHVNYEECIKKRNDVLYAMLDFGLIDYDEYENAVNEILSVIPLKEEEKSERSWFIETVNQEVVKSLCEKYKLSESAAEAILYNGGLKIYTTENKEIQETLESYFENAANFPAEIQNGLDFSMVVCDSKNANLLGIVGSFGEKTADRLLNLAEVPIIPGSSLKPLALYAPLINNGKINWSTVFDDVPIEFTKKGADYTAYPQNYPRRYDGLITVKDALRLSKNTIAVRLYNMLGAEKIYGSLKRDFGFETIIRNYRVDDGVILTDLAPAPLALGQLTYGVSLRRLTEAYTVFPSYGTFGGGRSFIAVYDEEGNLLIDNSPTEKRVFTKECAEVMNKLLSCVTESGTASAISLKKRVDTAGKTGTSGDDKDRLFVGYTPYYTAGIWCGYRESDKSINKISPTHIKIWDDVMSEIHDGLLRKTDEFYIEKFSIDGLVVKEYCKDSGKIPSEACEKDPRENRTEVGYFIKRHQPIGKCNTHVLCSYDIVGEGVATDLCPTDSVEKIALIRVKGRHFPKEIIITDADYVYYDVDGTREFADSPELPYYFNYVEDDDFIGKGRNKKQFNCSCNIHRD